MTTTSGTIPPALRAAEAARSIVRTFGGRLWHLPLTHLGRAVVPRSPAIGAWHYWWQAQYLDCLVDAGWRMLATQGPAAAGVALRTADALLRTIWLRNGLRYVNPYYDDQAWLLLATGRLAALHEATDRARSRRIHSAARVLAAQLVSAHTDDHGGGLWWHAVRDFKNIPATGPAAVHFARTGQPDRAASLIDWCFTHLQDPTTGLFFDGLRAGEDGRNRVEPNIYTYNQGTVLGSLLALGLPDSLARAEALVAAVDSHLTRPGGSVLVTHGPHDQALFTGILARYLALAATDQRLSPATRARAQRCVQDTADVLWEQRSRRAAGSGRGSASATFFSTDTGRSADEALPRNRPIELSGQLQAWMILEAAHLVASSQPAAPPVEPDH